MIISFCCKFLNVFLWEYAFQLWIFVIGRSVRRCYFLWHISDLLESYTSVVEYVSVSAAVTVGGCASLWTSQHHAGTTLFPPPSLSRALVATNSVIVSAAHSYIFWWIYWFIYIDSPFLLTRQIIHVLLLKTVHTNMLQNRSYWQELHFINFSE